MAVLKPFEKWRLVNSLLQLPLKKKYAVTTFGRVISFTKDIEADGMEIGRSLHEGYRAIKLKLNGGKKNFTLLVHKAVAECYLDPPTEEHKFIIHKDRNKLNNRPENLKWVTKEEWWEHWKKSEAVQESLKKLHAPKQDGHKLTSTDVIRIKRMLADPHRKNTIARIAKMFKVSEMQIHRIKTGENWSHIKP
jgi:hypothetical protein